MSDISQSQNMPSSQSRPAKNPSDGPAFLFDFDGTLLDSVYQHVLAWHEALLKAGIELSVWRIHRRIGMSGGLLVNALSRETGRRLTDEEGHQLQQWHAEAYLRQIRQVRPLPGSRDLLAYLTTSGTPWAIATSGRMQTAGPNLAVLGIGSDVRIITRDQVARAKPDPDLFLAAAELLRVPISSFSGGWRQRLGYACRPSRWGARSRALIGRIRQRRVGKRGRVPSVQRSGRPAMASR